MLTPSTMFTDPACIAKASAQLALVSQASHSLPKILEQARKDDLGMVFSIAPKVAEGKPYYEVLVAAKGAAVEFRYDLLSGERISSW